MKQIVSVAFFVIFFSTCFFSSLSVIFAQSSSGPAGTTLIPATIEAKTDPGKQIEKTLSITNESNEERTYYIFVRNIKGVEGGGVPIFADDDLESTGYEIKDWIKLEKETVVIQPHSKVEFNVIISVPENASPGSHFGGIFASVEPPRLREIGAGVGYEVASIVSLRISGDILDDARIRSFSSDKLFYSSKNVNFVARIENQGNILIRPRGPLTITSMFGGDSDIQIVNDSQAGVFPSSVRDFEFNWKKEGLGFGRYEAVLALAYDGERGQKTIDASVYFWILPTKILIPIAVGFITILVGGYLFTKFYVSRAVMKAAGGRRISSRRYRRQVGVSRFAFVLVTLMAVLVLFLIVLLIFFA